MKKVIKTLRNLTISFTWKMFRGLISQPILLLPTVWATVESILYSEVNFQESHSGRGVSNAFRHAAWNLLIAKHSSYFTSNEKAVNWAKFITDLHEECFPNEEFDNRMDLHNNRIGREIFEKSAPQKLSKKEMIAELISLSESAVGLTDEKEFENHRNEMVYFAEKNERVPN